MNGHGCGMGPVAGQHLAVIGAWAFQRLLIQLHMHNQAAQPSGAAVNASFFPRTRCSSQQLL